MCMREEGIWLSPGGCFTNVSRALQNILSNFVYCRTSTSYENFKLKLCSCAQSHALGTHTKFQLEILTINVITGIVYFREIILESSRNVSANERICEGWVKLGECVRGVEIGIRYRTEVFYVVDVCVEGISPRFYVGLINKPLWMEAHTTRLHYPMLSCCGISCRCCLAPSVNVTELYILELKCQDSESNVLPEGLAAT